jgi:F-type H+-transporting ATPase subunit gamma
VRRFNSNLVKAAKAKAMELTAAGKNVQFYLVGKKGRAPIRRDYPEADRREFRHQHRAQPRLCEAEAIAASWWRCMRPGSSMSRT